MNHATGALTLHLFTVSIIQNCLSVLLEDTLLGKTRALWSIETSHLTPPPHPQALTSWVYHIPRVVSQDLLSSSTAPSLLPLLAPPPLTLSPSDLCVSSVSSFLKNGVSSGFTLAASRGIHGYEPVHGGTPKHDRIDNINLSPSLTCSACLKLLTILWIGAPLLYVIEHSQ